MKKIIILFWFLWLSLLFSGCQINSQEDMWWYIDVINEDDVIFNSADRVIKILEDGQVLNLLDWIHPDRWIRFSPYTYIDVDVHNVLFPEDIINDSGQSYIWGYNDWKWDAIEMSISDYISQHVVNKNFLEADEILLNEKRLRWNNLNNIDEVYPNWEFIEYYFSGFDAQYDGMDWQSLTIVFEKIDGDYYVVWIINWSWTI